MAIAATTATPPSPVSSLEATPVGPTLPGTTAGSDQLSPAFQAALASGSATVNGNNVSTTTLSNANKMSAVPGIQAKTDSFSNTGSSYDANGNIIHANGTTTPAPLAPAPNPNPQPNPSTATTGGYIGDIYYPPNATLPVGADGQPQATTTTSATDDTIFKSLNDQLTKSDALTASIVQNIQSQYEQLINQQKQTNAGQEANTNNALLMGGVTGQGSSSQFAPISSAGIVQAQVSYGLSQIADLQSKENSAIIAAKQAGQNADFQLQNKINDQISKIRDDKVAAATKLNDTIATQNKKLADDKLQQTKDTAVSNLYSSGTTDPADILKQLTDQGLTISASEVNAAIKNIDPGKAGIQTIAQEAAKAGASAETVKAILASSDPAAALTLATPAMGAAAQATLQSKLFTPPTAKELGGAQFYKYPNTSIVYSSKGQQISLQEFKQLTNQINVPDDKVNFGGIKTINPTVAGTGSSTKTSASKLKDVHNQNDQIFSTLTGKAKGDPQGDNHVSPEDFNHAADLFVQNKLGTYQQFYTAHKSWANPTDIKRGNIKGS